MITGTQIRAARALLAWSQSELAERADRSLPTIKRLEARGNRPAGSARTNESVRRAIEAAGVVFIDDDADGGRGVRLGIRNRGARGRQR
ncbi:MAG: helix-turn-helix domain-containing protein [Deltaproteobacteria bacterium]|nr:helix-turn-helix domain-containing protein [Deltaproteobacteria bacterium]